MDLSVIAREVLETEAKELLDVSSKFKEIDWEGITSLIMRSTGKLIVCGVGKSGLVGAKMAATFASTGTPSFFLHPIEALHGDLGAVSKEDVILAISYSGESEELVRVLPHLRRLSRGIVTMSRSALSSVSKMGDFFIPVAVSKEACPLNAAPTCSTTLTMAMGDALAVCLMRRRNFKESDFASFHPGGSLGKRLFVKVKDLMRTNDLPLVSSQMPLREVIVKMSGAGLGSAILVEEGRLCGVLSDGDLRRAMMRDDFSLDDAVSPYASKNPKYCDNVDLLAVDALKFIEDEKIQLLVVTDGNKTVLGVLHLHMLISAGIK